LACTEAAPKITPALAMPLRFRKSLLLFFIPDDSSYSYQFLYQPVSL